ncbi:hypothetical protein VHARVF571_200003 [Vibrio harveyi]|nr:hypothetical protein TH15OA1_200131 [Vibrio harveyi]CAH1528401.1 hypothetical protein VHARVF571_200003 [Vibrio harveyi]
MIQLSLRVVSQLIPIINMNSLNPINNEYKKREPVKTPVY